MSEFNEKMKSQSYTGAIPKSRSINFPPEVNQNYANSLKDNPQPAYDMSFLNHSATYKNLFPSNSDNTIMNPHLNNINKSKRVTFFNLNEVFPISYETLPTIYETTNVVNSYPRPIMKTKCSFDPYISLPQSSQQYVQNIPNSQEYVQNIPNNSNMNNENEYQSNFSHDQSQGNNFSGNNFNQNDQNIRARESFLRRLRLIPVFNGETFQSLRDFIDITDTLYVSCVNDIESRELIEHIILQLRGEAKFAFENCVNIKKDGGYI